MVELTEKWLNDPQIEEEKNSVDRSTFVNMMLPTLCIAFKALFKLKRHFLDREASSD